MRNTLRNLIILFFAATAIPVQAQGVFDLSAISNKLGMTPATTTPTGGTTKGAPAPAVSPAALTYKRSPQLSAQNLQKFIAGVKQMNADVGAQMEQGLAGVDLFGALDQGLAKYGARTDNLGDVLAVYYLSSWMAANGRDEDATMAQVEGTKKMVHSSLGHVPELAKLSDADKQSTTEGILLQMFFNEMMVEGVKSDPQALAQARAGIKEGTKVNAGFDVDRFDLGPNGLVTKK